MRSLIAIAVSLFVFTSVVPLLANARRVEFTLVVQHHVIDDVDPVSGESFSRLGALVNGTYPGPTLEVQLGDEVSVTVVNQMPTSGLTMHFHGQHMVNSYYADGVHGLTQCDIAPGGSFTHNFVAEPAGTFMYHSHMPYQFGDGVFGAFIVHDPTDDPYHHTVDDEVVIGLSDWFRDTSEHVHEYVAQFHFDDWPLTFYRAYINGKAEQDPYIYNVADGTSTIRLRMYALGVEYGFRLHLAQHALSVIAADGSLVAAHDVDFVDIYSGERYDFLLHIDNEQRPVGTYELRARIIDYQGRLMDKYVSAYIQYSKSGGSPAPEVVTADAVMGNDNGLYRVLDNNNLKAYKDSENSGNFASGYKPLPGPLELLQGDDNLWIYKTTSYGIRGESSFVFMDSWDFHMFRLPSHPLVFDDAPMAVGAALESEKDVHFATAVALKGKDITVGDAVIGPRIQNLKLGQVIDIVFENAPSEGNEHGMFSTEHPNHIHGHYVWVLGEGSGSFSDRDEAAAQLNFIDPPQRDNVLVRPNSWTAVRLEASNPGMWLMHCHTETHSNFGMATILMVGDHDERPNLPNEFPRCDNGVMGSSQPLVDAPRDVISRPSIVTFVMLVLIASLYLVWRKRRPTKFLKTRYRNHFFYNGAYRPDRLGRTRSRPRSMSVPPMTTFHSDSTPEPALFHPERTLRKRAYFKLSTAEVV